MSTPNRLPLIRFLLATTQAMVALLLLLSLSRPWLDQEGLNSTAELLSYLGGVIQLLGAGWLAHVFYRHVPLLLERSHEGRERRDQVLRPATRWPLYTLIAGLLLTLAADLLLR